MKILLCPPDHFDIDYVINPWMDTSNKVDKTLVWEQYRGLESIYKNIGIELEYMQAVQGLPDMVYTANYGIRIGSKFVLANFKFDERKKESDYAKTYFAAKGFEIIELPKELFFEGEGDMLPAGGRYFMGYGKRSHFEAAAYIAEHAQVEIVPLELVNPYYYHLDTCFSYLGNDTILINQESFTPKGIETLHQYFKNIVYTNPIDNKIIVCNMIVYHQNIVVGKGMSDVTKSKLQSFGFQLHENDMSQYLKGGGSVKCCSLIIE